MRCCPSPDQEDGHAADPKSCTPTKATTTPAVAPLCVRVASKPASLAAAKTVASILGCHRWVVERTLAWLNRFRRLRVRYERRADIHQAFLTLGCVLICHNHLQRFC